MTPDPFKVGRAKHAKLLHKAFIREAGDLPERRLWIAVIIRGVNDACGLTGSMNTRNQHKDRRLAIKDAKRWLALDCPDFIYVCNAAGLDPNHVIETMRQRQATGPRLERLAKRMREEGEPSATMGDEDGF